MIYKYLLFLWPAAGKFPAVAQHPESTKSLGTSGYFTSAGGCLDSGRNLKVTTNFWADFDFNMNKYGRNKNVACVDHRIFESRTNLGTESVTFLHKKIFLNFLFLESEILKWIDIFLYNSWHNKQFYAPLLWFGLFGFFFNTSLLRAL